MDSQHASGDEGCLDAHHLHIVSGQDILGIDIIAYKSIDFIGCLDFCARLLSFYLNPSNNRYSMCQLALKSLPSEVYETKWDLIMVDAPTGYHEEAPGRMSAIYTAGMMARNREEGGETDVFVHDVNREVEDKFSRAFLCDGYMKKQEGRLRHFRIPSHRGNLDKPFCP